MDSLGERSRQWVLPYIFGHDKDPLLPMKTPSARHVAVDRLLSSRTGEVPDAHLSPRESALAVEMTSGTIRWRRWLDFLIDSFYSGQANKLEPRVRTILRLAFHDLLLMRTPDHAVVHEWVDIAKTTVRVGAGGLVNALLRECVRTRGQLPQPDTGDRVVDLAIAHSHPDWIVSRWMSRFGEDQCVALLRYNNTNPTFGLRVNRLRSDLSRVEECLSSLGVRSERGRTADFLRVVELSAVLRSEEFAGGHFSVQDEAAGLVVRVLQPAQGGTVLDVCSAPGGKAMYAAELMGNVGDVIAADRDATRLKKVAEAAERLGCSIVRTLRADATQPPGVSEVDRVLADVPCSGLGVLSKRADLRWRMTPDRIRQLVGLQGRILRATADAVKVGGCLVYSTCTIEPEENLEQVERFLDADSRFELVPVVPVVPDLEVPTSEGCYVSLPHVDAMDGAFAARLRRVNR